MSRTEQTRSWATLSNAGEDLNANKPEPETEDNKTLLLSVFDSLNNLYEKLNRLDYLIKKRNMEQELYPKNINEFNEIIAECENKQ